jgi:hypothetical protein
MCANFCFGGVKKNRLFITAGRSLYSVYVEAQGAQHPLTPGSTIIEPKRVGGECVRIAPLERVAGSAEDRVLWANTLAACWRTKLK